jgi:hypothetical protein
MRDTFKLSVFEVFPYADLKLVIDSICALGYSCECVSNGNFVFSRVVKQ